MSVPHFEKDQIIKQLKKQIKINRHIIGVAAGSGLTAKYAEEGGADLILALSSGLFRQKGLSSLAAYLPFVNSNDKVMEFGLKELLPRINKIPVIFGVMATDPSIHLENFIQQVKEKGFAGINNYPTVGLIDGKYREALEEQGISYKQEVESISIANKFGLLTVAFVFNKEQAIQMVNSGADVICVHLGLTTGGKLGSKHIQSLQSAKILAQEIFDVVTERNPDIIKMVYGGPVNKPVDVQFIYDGTNIDGYIGGSVFERIPAEQVVLQVTESFKKTNEVRYDELIEKIISGFSTIDDYIDFIKRYISLHYKDEISLNEISEILHVSRSHLSTLFKKNVGVSFTDYLIDFRLNRALEIYQEKRLPLTIIAELVGYQNYSQFSKIFKKRKGKSPREFIKSNITTS
ncbi:transcriptional regulator, AraC family [Caldibacillus thermoamylovorans]|uniref:Transcriptional regulator, AraC family n=1 Tax=Caldibacillus thermoamylovorans TaxID=35841 RepID=A0A090KN20_9BACI|nr:transcriptional regulator, AraC family [Caldibacillus thermoamylovorans]